jgi:hypothetical protein
MSWVSFGAGFLAATLLFGGAQLFWFVRDFFASPSLPWDPTHPADDGGGRE